MGLDMYLEADKYLPTATFYPREDRRLGEQIKELVGLADLPSHGGYGGVTVTVQVGYWRKANAIHGWFVSNCQDGVDDCRRAYVDRERLEELRGLCQNILDSVKSHTELRTSQYGGDPYDYEVIDEIDSDAVAELSPVGGFFFGSTDIDGYYLTDLRETVRQIDGVLASEALKGCDFYYHSSW